MAFTPGSQHTARVTLRNSGLAPTALPQGIRLTISPDVGLLVTGQGAVISPGSAGEWGIPFTISPSAVPGRQNTWDLSVPYDGKTLTAQGVAFTVEALPPIPGIWQVQLSNPPDLTAWMPPGYKDQTQWDGMKVGFFPGGVMDYVEWESYYMNTFGTLAPDRPEYNLGGFAAPLNFPLLLSPLTKFAGVPGRLSWYGRVIVWPDFPELTYYSVSFGTSQVFTPWLDKSYTWDLGDGVWQHFTLYRGVVS